MSHHDYLSRLADRFRDSGYAVEEGLRLENQYFCLVAHRTRFAFPTGFAEECFIVTYTAKLTREKLLNLMTDCSDYAVHYSPPRPLWKQLIGSVRTIYCLVLADEASGDSLSFVRQTPRLMPCGLVVPVLFDLPSGEIHAFEKCPIAGGAIYRMARKVIRKQFAGLPIKTPSHDSPP